MNFLEFLQNIWASPPLLVTVVLTLGVILVNGWTDAPNAIATCVSTRAIKVKTAIIMAAVFNFLGVLVMTAVSSKVAATISTMVDFGSNAGDASVALCAALVAIVVWATAAWKFGIPTSESHALIAGLTGAAIALHGNLDGIVFSAWVNVIYGLIHSTVLGFVSGFVIVRFIEFCMQKTDRRKTVGFFKNAQVFGGASMAFMHGAQDGQKFMGVFLLGMCFVNGSTSVSDFSIPLWLMILCSSVMGLGTSIGGYRIIKSVGMDMVRLQPYQGFSADIASASCLLVSSLTGMPVSTTHTKTTAIMGVGASKRITAVNWSIVREMMLAWILTFPGCVLMGFLFAKVFMMIF